MPLQMASGSVLDRFWLPKWVPNRGPEGIQTRFLCISVTDREKEGSCKLCSCIINIAKMQSDCENTGVFKDFPFITLVAFGHHLITRRPQKSIQNRSLRCSKTSPKRCSKSHTSWKRFRDGFGTILDSQLASQRRSLRRPRGLQKRLLFNLASREASRMDFGCQLDPFGLGFFEFLEVILAY